MSKDAPKLASYTILDGYINTSIVLQACSATLFHGPDCFMFVALLAVCILLSIQVVTFAFHVTRALGKTKVDFLSTFSTVATQIIFAFIVFEWLFVRVCNHDSALKVGRRADA